MLVLWWCGLFFSAAVLARAACPPDRLAVYRMLFVMEWSEKTFPKQYPKWRPPAHWATVVGRTHNATYRLWQLGAKSSDEMKVYTETGRTDLLNHMSQGQGGVLDVFYAQPDRVGVGQTEATFFVNSNHSKVSVASRIVPSPDWFVGVDSLELCGKGRFLGKMAMDVGPLDAGTDNGFTFTSPDWETVPRSPITRITAHHPNHSANSFYYPRTKKLSRLGYFQFQKLAEYELKESVTLHVRKVNLRPKADDAVMKEEEEKWKKNAVYQLEQEVLRDATEAPEPTEPPPRRIQPRPEDDVVQNVVEEEADLEEVKKRRRKNKAERKRKHGPRPCRVSEWGEWSACSKSCGFGQSNRSRKVIRHAKRGGRPCPPLQENHWCGSARNCRTAGYFSWDG